MNTTALHCTLTLVSLMTGATAFGNVGHVSAPHLPTTSVHLGATTGLHAGPSFPQSYAMLTSGLNASFASINQTPLLANGYALGGVWPQPMMGMPINGMMMPMTGMTDMPPLAPIAATELSPMATGPMVATMPVPVTPIPMPTMSFMAQSMNGPWGATMLDDDGLPITNALESTSLFAFSPEKPRVFKEHDLVQIIVRETTRIESFQGLETEKEYGLIAGVEAFPGLNDYDLLKYTGLEAAGEKEFEGEGEYAREDNLTTRLAAEVIEILPNGNLVLEARTRIKTDDEEMYTQLTGVCRPEDITAANSILSNQIFDLQVEKMHFGQVRDAANKGILARVLDAVFAF